MKRDMIALIGQWPESGLTQKEFCKKHRLTYHTFQYWLRKSRQRLESPTGFIEITPWQSQHVPAIELHLVNGIRLVFHQLPSSDFIRSLVQ